LYSFISLLTDEWQVGVDSADCGATATVTEYLYTDANPHGSFMNGKRLGDVSNLRPESHEKEAGDIGPR
jgi:hypothetical protein